LLFAGGAALPAFGYYFMATGGDSAQNPAHSAPADYRLLQVSWAFWSFIAHQPGKCPLLFTGGKDGSSNSSGGLMAIVRDLRWDKRSRRLVTTALPEYDLLHKDALPCPKQRKQQQQLLPPLGASGVQQQQQQQQQQRGRCSVHVPPRQRITLATSASAAEIRLTLPLNATTNTTAVSSSGSGGSSASPRSGGDAAAAAAGAAAAVGMAVLAPVSAERGMAGVDGAVQVWLNVSSPFANGSRAATLSAKNYHSPPDCLDTSQYVISVARFEIFPDELSVDLQVFVDRVRAPPILSFSQLLEVA
jgi:hypothetical protein